MRKYFVNTNPQSDFYLSIYVQLEDGRLWDELGNGAGWDAPDDLNPADLQEVTHEQYSRILECHQDGGEDFDGDWNNYEDYVWKVLGVTLEIDNT